METVCSSRNLEKICRIQVREYTKFFKEGISGRNHFRNIGVHGQTQSGRVWAGFIWLVIGTNGEFL
jgi:hypothetical protein